MIIHCHNPKTAGTAFSQILKDTFKSRFVDLYCLYPPRWTKTDYKGISQVYGHAAALASHSFAIRKMRTYFRSAIFVTFLRDPVEVYASYYYYLRRCGNWKLAEHDISSRSFLEFLHLVADDKMGRQRNDFPIGGFRFAIEEITKQADLFDYVGVSEHFELSVAAFQAEHHRTLDCTSILAGPINGNGARVSGTTYREALSPEELDLVLQISGDECEIYQRVRDRFLPRAARTVSEARMKKLVPWVVNQCRRDKIERVVVFGAGSHTQVLQPLWEEVQGPPVVRIMVTDPICQSEFLNLPLITVKDYRPTPGDGIVLSSHTYEEAMAATCRQFHPHVPCYSMYHCPNCRHPM